MGALLARLVDDAALCPPGRAPMDGALAAHRDAGHDPVVGRLLCPASRFAELRARLVPEDLLDLGVIADAGIDGLSETLDAVHAEPRVRPSAVRIALPEDADQARAAAVTLARLPPGVPAHIEVRHSPGWRDALDRVRAARDHGAPLAAAFRVTGPPTELATSITACAARDLAFTCAATDHHPHILLAAALAATGERDVRRTLERTDLRGLTADLRALTEPEALATRRLLLAFSAPDIRAALTRLNPAAA
ncbi:hypothetical protein BZB76_5717 [Actinomadura pelletieri DSM 43383]|uniref:Transaldolase n=1 Tax=Actinomadura pelletieri DSM 43383 TaxID=1120940 RepID=A0A495QH65_9ACTN|nr:hypothetical protein [Actinomadura pelletieri]RKS71230.1 hypothetical protein BZB76_5717 [Actinomadura pelletieri DSM 43383]